MKRTTFFKSLLVAAGLGANGVFAQTTLYERGTTGHDWSDADLTDWVVDSDHGSTTKSDESGSVTNVTSSIESNYLKFNSFGYSYNEQKNTTEYPTTAAKAYSFTKSITTEQYYSKTNSRLGRWRCYWYQWQDTPYFYFWRYCVHTLWLKWWCFLKDRFC